MSVCKRVHLQNGEFLNINFVDENLSELRIPKNLLLSVFLMRCVWDRPDCTNPGGMTTDFNIWDRSMDDDELVDWTTCK